MPSEQLDTAAAEGTGINLYENRAIKRTLRNLLLSQKRFIEAEKDICEEVFYEMLSGYPDLWKNHYVDGRIDLETYEAIVDHTMKNTVDDLT